MKAKPAAATTSAKATRWFQRMAVLRYKMAKALKTARVMISWPILSCTGDQTLLPQRLAGTCSTYSKKAMPQLTMMTSQMGRSLNFKCPYQANVIKTFEQVNNTNGSQRGWVIEFRY